MDTHSGFQHTIRIMTILHKHKDGVLEYLRNQIQHMENELQEAQKSVTRCASHCKRLSVNYQNIQGSPRFQTQNPILSEKIKSVIESGNEISKSLFEYYKMKEQMHSKLRLETEKTIETLNENLREITKLFQEKYE